LGDNDPTGDPCRLSHGDTLELRRLGSGPLFVNRFIRPPFFVTHVATKIVGDSHPVKSKEVGTDPPQPRRGADAPDPIRRPNT
jgi:hypothetical protein